MLEHYLAVAEPWLQSYGYWALFILVFVEGFGIPAPGQTIIIASAMLAKQGGMDIKWVLLLAWMAAFIGDNIGYLIGRWGGKAVLLKLPIKPVQLIRMEGFFLKYGAGIVLVARFISVLRLLNGVVAGSMGMPWKKFVFYNLVGAALWVGVWGGGSYFLSDYMAQLINWLAENEGYLIGAVIAVVVLGGGFWWWRGRYKKHNRRE